MGGHQGGAIKLNYHGKLKNFATHLDSERGFSFWAFHSSRQEELEPITSGAMALLVV